MYGLPLVPAFSLRPMLLSGQKRVAMLFWPIFGYFMRSVVSIVTLKRKIKEGKRRIIFLNISKNVKPPINPKS